LIITLLFVAAQTAFAQDENLDPNNTPAPELKFANKTIDLGKAWGGTKIKANIKFTNEGNAPLEIKKVKPSCGCMASKLEQKIYQPGETGAIDLSYQVKNRTHLAKAYVVITSNDPQHPNTKVNLKANVTQLIETEPRYLTFSNLEVNKSTTKSIHVKTKKPLLVKTDLQFPDIEDCKIEITPKEQTVTNNGADFNITVTPSAIGRFTNGIIIKSEDENKNPIESRTNLTAMATGPVIASPKYLFINVVKGKTRQRKLQLKSKDPNEPLTIEQIDYDKEMINIKVNPTEKTSTIDLLVNPDPNATSKKSQVKSTIKIKAKTGSQTADLSIPISLYYRTARKPSKQVKAPSAAIRKRNKKTISVSTVSKPVTNPSENSQSENK
ncbi:MAG: DUF1573 domain-containing protein, partial [Planctomycetota bacterium]